MQCTRCGRTCQPGGVISHYTTNRHVTTNIHGFGTCTLRIKAIKCRFVVSKIMSTEVFYDPCVRGETDSLYVCRKCNRVYFKGVKVYDGFAPPAPPVDSELVRSGVSLRASKDPFVIKSKTESNSIVIRAPPGYRVDIESFVNYQGVEKYNLILNGTLGFIYTDFQTEAEWRSSVNHDDVVPMMIVQ